MKTPRPESNPSRRWLSRLAASTAFTVAALFDLGLSSAIAAPLESSLLFSAKIDSFAAADGESTGDWSSYMPAAQTFTVRGNPKVKTFGGVKWVKNLREGAGDGYAVLNDGTPIPCSGVTIVAAVKPIYRTDPRGEPRGEIVDIFYDRLALAISHTDGRIMVCRNYWVDWGPAISNGESTVLSLVVQTDGSYEVFANGVSVMTGGANGDFTTLTPPDAWKSWIGIGRNIWDGWSSYNGHLGDVYVYKTALGATDRETLEAELTTKFVTPPVDYTIDATATGPGGTISPAGPIAVPEGYDKTFLIAPVSGYTIASVVTGSGGDVMGSLVDINYGGAQTYPFTNVLADDSITATFAADANPATRYEAENPDNAFDNAGYPMEWHPNCSGGVCVGKWGEGAIGGFTVNVTPSESGLYDMTVADGGYGDRGTWVKVNGVDLVGNPFTPTSRNGENQGTFQCVVPLLAGANTITIYAPAGQWGPHWDYIDVADSRSGPANKITSSADAGGTISPLGDIYCAPGATIPFTITPDLYYDVASVLTSTVVGDQKVGFATQTYNMVNVTAADTIAASFIAWDPTYITGTVTVGAIPLPGVQITATGPRGPFVTTTSDPDGTYSIQVRPGETYAVTAKKSQYSLAPASQDVLAGATADLTATFVGLQPLIDLSVDTLSEGTLISWANDGTLTGQFVADGLKDTIAPTVVADYYGKKAVQFNNNKMLLSATSDTGDSSLIKAPAEITGNGPWTFYAQVCSGSALPWEQYYFAFAHNGNDANCAAFGYGFSPWFGAVAHWGWTDMGWNSPEADGGPSIGEWHDVAVTFDGATEKVYLDGTEVNSENKTLALWTANPFYLGCRNPDWSGNGWGRDAPFNGALAAVQVYDDALSAEEIAELGKPPSGNDYASWAAAQVPPVIGGPSEDSNNDGVQNGIAYFMGLSGIITNPGLDASNAVIWPMSATFDGTYEVQTSADLSIWNNVDPRPLPADGNLTYTLPSGLGMRFVRLLVTPN